MIFHILLELATHPDVMTAVIFALLISFVGLESEKLARWWSIGSKRARDLWITLWSEHTTPREIGLAVATGVFIGCTPALGFHGWIALGVATIANLNRIWAWVGSRISNILILPWIVIAEIEIGHHLRFGGWMHLSKEEVMERRGKLLLDWLIGSVPIGIALAIVLGLLAFGLAHVRLRKNLPEKSPDNSEEKPGELKLGPFSAWTGHSLIVTSPEERRKKRSQDPLVALHYQLSIARTEGDLETIVLADHAGTVVAGAGAWAACEGNCRLCAAACAKWKAPPIPGLPSSKARSRVRSLRISGQDVLLCSRRTRSAAPASRGCDSRAPPRGSPAFYAPPGRPPFSQFAPLAATACTSAAWATMTATTNGGGSKAIPGLIRRAVVAGVEKATEAPDSIKHLVGDLKLPKEIASYIFAQVDETKNGLFRVVAKEMRDFLEHTNLSGEMTKSLHFLEVQG